MTKSFKCTNYVLNNFSAILKCLKKIIKDKNILDLININIKKLDNSKYYIESNFLYILNKNNESFSIKITPSIEEPNKIEIIKLIDLCTQNIKVEKNENIITICNDITKNNSNHSNKIIEYSAYKNEILIFKSKQELNIDTTKQSKEFYNSSMIIDEFGKYVLQKGTKIETQDIVFEKSTYYKGILPEIVKYKDNKNNTIENITKYSVESTEEEYFTMKEKLKEKINIKTDVIKKIK